MKKRLRKKRYLGEFREDCFLVSFNTPSNFTDEDVDKWLDEFIEMIERNGLSCGGGGGGGGCDHWEFFVSFCGRGTATEAHRLLIRRWLEDHDHVIDVIVGELRDAGSDFDD